MVKLLRVYSKLSDHNPLTLQTDRQTCDRNTAHCINVHRAVKTLSVKCVVEIVARRTDDSIIAR